MELHPDTYDLKELLPCDLQGWNGDSPRFQEFVEKTNPKTIIEVGSWKGQSAVTMGKLVKGKNCKIYCIDTWLGAPEFWVGPLSKTPERNLHLKNGYPQIYYQFISNIIHQSLQDVIVPIPNTSLTGAKILKHHQITAQLIYIDASHEYQDVLQDIEAFYPLLTQSGIIFGDDYNDYWHGVKQATQEFAKKNKLSLQIVDGFWYIIKP